MVNLLLYVAMSDARYLNFYRKVNMLPGVLCSCVCLLIVRKLVQTHEFRNECPLEECPCSLSVCAFSKKIFLSSTRHYLVEVQSATLFSGTYLLQHGLFHRCRAFEVFQHDLVHSHRIFEVYWLQHGPILRPQSLQGCTYCDLHITMATNALECVSSHVDQQLCSYNFHVAHSNQMCYLKFLESQVGFQKRTALF